MRRYMWSSGFSLCALSSWAGPRGGDVLLGGRRRTSGRRLRRGRNSYPGDGGFAYTAPASTSSDPRRSNTPQSCSPGNASSSRVGGGRFLLDAGEGREENRLDPRFARWWPCGGSRHVLDLGMRRSNSRPREKKSDRWGREDHPVGLCGRGGRRIAVLDQGAYKSGFLRRETLLEFGRAGGRGVSSSQAWRRRGGVLGLDSTKRCSCVRSDRFLLQPFGPGLRHRRSEEGLRRLASLPGGRLGGNLGGDRDEGDGRTWRESGLGPGWGWFSLLPTRRRGFYHNTPLVCSDCHDARLLRGVLYNAGAGYESSAPPTRRPCLNCHA